MLSVQCLAETSYPEDVRQFISRRAMCDHFHNEEPYDEDRRRFLNRKAKKFCSGTDKHLAVLKAKYRGKQNIINKLNEFEENIELQSK